MPHRARKTQVLLLALALGGLWGLGAGAGRLLRLWVEGAPAGTGTPAAALSAEQRCQRGVPPDIAQRCIEALRGERARQRGEGLGLLALGLGLLAPPLLLGARRRRASRPGSAAAPGPGTAR